METSVDPEIVALTGIPLRQTINEADLAIWDRRLKAPARMRQSFWPSTATPSIAPSRRIPRD